MSSSATTPLIMAKKKDSTNPLITAKHEAKAKSATTDGSPQSVTSTRSLDDKVGNTESSPKTIRIKLMNTKRPPKTIGTKLKLKLMNTKCPPKVSQASHNPVSLVDLPLELLFMIFDYAACRDHLEDPGYPIRLKRRDSLEYELVIFQPSLLMVCASLRSALSAHFYASYSFHARFGTRSLLKSSKSGLNMQAIDDKLPHPLSLSTIRLTIEIREVSRQGFERSILFESGKKLFEDYRTMKLDTENEFKHINLPWRLVCTDSTFMKYISDGFNSDLQLLLEALHETAVESVSLEPCSLRAFYGLLATWLDGTENLFDPTYRIRNVLERLPRSTSTRPDISIFWYYYDFSKLL